jgi:hypothetical protein
MLGSLVRLINIRSGKTLVDHHGEFRFRRNFEDYALEIRSWTWSLLTNRDWQQFSIHQEDYALFVLERSPELVALLPHNIGYTVIPCEDLDRLRIVIEGVTVSITVDVSVIEIIVEGELPDNLALRLAEEIRANAEAAIHHRCVLERV